MTLQPADTPMYDRLIAFWRWVEAGYCIIRNKDGDQVPLRPKPIQRRIFKAMLKQAQRGQPIRIIVLKARKEGVSTLIECLYSFLCKYYPHTQALVIAHTDKDTHEIFAIASRAATEDAGGPAPSQNSAGVGIVYAHGSHFTTRTAGGVHPGRGSNKNLLHLSELSFWEGADRVKEIVAAVMQSVPDRPNSIIVIESTASKTDVSRQFRSRWDSAMSDEANAFEPMFFSWFDDPDYCLPGIGADDPSTYEKWLMEEHGVLPSQVAWYRRKKASDFHGDDHMMMQEYPSTPEEAFASPDGLVFPRLSVERNAANLTWEQMEAHGYRFYRAVDFGGVDPFTCVWVACKPDMGVGNMAERIESLTIDHEACPNLWRELREYAYDDRKPGYPADVNNHAIDPLRYAIMHFHLTGHVHVFQEYYVPESVKKDLTLLNHAEAILRRSGTYKYRGTVCDRSRPDSIHLLNTVSLALPGGQRLKLNALANERPPQTDRGEILDGITRMHALMKGDNPLRGALPEVSPIDVIRRAAAQRGMPLRRAVDPFAPTYAQPDDEEPEWWM